jgi:hypothetical protein
MNQSNARPPDLRATTLYDTDFYAWTQQQATLLEAEEFAELDLHNLIEELEAMGRSEKRELASRLQVLLMHLLKWHYETSMRSRSWQSTIRIQRRELARLLADNPSLRPTIPDVIAQVYPDAVLDVIEETGLLAPVFPATCPYSSTEVFDRTFWP